MRTIPINNGFYNIKSLGGEIFKSAYKEVDNFFGVNQPNVLEYDGKKYLVGNGKISLSPDKTDNEATKIFILNMLCRLMKDKPYENFNLFLTSPPSTILNQKKALPNYLKGNYSVVYGGDKKDIVIYSVTVFPETILAYFANKPQQFKRPVIVLDIGGVTTNAVLISNGSYDSKSIISYPNGMYHLEYDISNYLNAKYTLNIARDDVSFYLKEGLRMFGSDVDLIEAEKETIESFYKEFMENIIEKFQLKKWNYKMYDILVTGGGGKNLFAFIKDNFFPQAILSKDPLFDNLNGLAVIAKMKKEGR